jgi:type I restriction enzyme S subunit
MSSDLKTLADKGQARPALVPKLRFPDFNDGRKWEVSTIGDSNPFVTSGSRGWAPFYSKNGDLFVRITNLLRDSIYLDLTDSKYVQLPPGANEGVRTQLKEHDVLISITADIGLIGYVDECVPSPAYINQHIALVRFDEEQLCGKYVAYFLASEKTQKLFRASTDTGTKAGMSLIGIQKIEIMFPGLPEQQKIADCLSSVDELLAAQARKVDALKTYKKGLMQQLFPRDGETQPRIRFPEFQNAGEWDDAPMGTLLMSSPDYGVNAAAVPFSDQLPKYLRITDISADGRYLPEKQVSVNLETIDGNYLDEGDIVLARTGASVGKSYQYRKEDGRLVFAGFLIRVKPHPKKLVSSYLTNFLATGQFWKWVAVNSARSGQPGINSTEYSSLIIPLPPTRPEQQRIATCLSSLDALITAETQKLEDFYMHKKGLMQQLFPSLDEVKL